MPDETSAEAAVAAASTRVSNWERWGSEDVLGTLNFIDGESDARPRPRSGRASRSRSQSSTASKVHRPGNIGRFNPVHTMTVTNQSDRGFPHGFGAADDVLMMPMQCATHWDGLGHIFDHGKAWNGRDANSVVTVGGDGVTGIEKVTHAFASRGVLLDVGRAVGGGGLADGFAITTEHLEATIRAQGATSTVGRGDVLLLRTGQLTRCHREGWGEYAGGPAPGVSLRRSTGFTAPRWPRSRPTPGARRSGPTSFPMRFSRGIRWRSRTWACTSGRCSISTFSPRNVPPTAPTTVLLIASPLAVKGGVGAPVNPIAVR